MSIDQMQCYYHKRAGEYDASMGYDDSEKIEKLESVISEMKKLVESRNVLELACGPGFWTSQISQTAKFIVATDYNQSTLEQAALKNLSADKVCFRQYDAYDLDTVEGEFDMLVAVDWFAHVPLSKMNSFLQSVNQRLPLGSQVVFLDQLPKLHSLTQQFDQEGNHIQIRKLNNGETFHVIKHFFSDEDYSKLFKGYFVELSIKRFPETSRVLVRATVDE